MKTILAVVAIAITLPAFAQTKPQPNLPPKVELAAHIIVAQAVTSMIFGPATVAYAISTGPWQDNPTLGIENRYKQVCESVLGGKWISDAPDKCPEGNWLRFWGYRAK